MKWIIFRELLRWAGDLRIFIIYFIKYYNIYYNHGIIYATYLISYLMNADVNELIIKYLW